MSPQFLTSLIIYLLVLALVAKFANGERNADTAMSVDHSIETYRLDVRKENHSTIERRKRLRRITAINISRRERHSETVAFQDGPYVMSRSELRRPALPTASAFAAQGVRPYFAE